MYRYFVPVYKIYDNSRNIHFTSAPSKELALMFVMKELGWTDKDLVSLADSLDKDLEKLTIIDLIDNAEQNEIIIFPPMNL